MGTDKNQPTTTDWLDILKKQADDPESIMNDQMDAEIAQVLQRVGKQDPGVIDALRKLVAEKLATCQIAACSRKQFDREKKSFLGNPCLQPTGIAELDQRTAEKRDAAMEIMNGWERNVRLFEAIAKGKTATLEMAIRAVEPNTRQLDGDEG